MSAAARSALDAAQDRGPLVAAAAERTAPARGAFSSTASLGAHAAVNGFRLLTLDSGIYAAAAAFPSLVIARV